MDPELEEPGVEAGRSAGEAHVDFTPQCAERLAREIYGKSFPDGKGYTRFISSSLWRAFSEPPQDWPLALCDARSVGADEGVPNTLHIVDRQIKISVRIEDQLLVSAQLCFDVVFQNCCVCQLR